MGGRGAVEAAGYSGRSLVAKLGINPGARIAILNPPRGYGRTLGRLPQAAIRRSRVAGSLDLIQFFATGRRQLERTFSPLERALAPARALWSSLAKQATCVATDLDEDAISA